MLSRSPIRKKRPGKPRRGPMRDPKYRKWLGLCLCSVFASSPNAEPYDRCRYEAGRSDPAHTVNNGMRSKGPDSSCAPLCRIHHDEYDTNREAFEKKYGLDMKRIAADWYSKYEETQASRERAQ